MKDYYKTLGVEKNASKEDVKKAYRRLAHQYHPDKGGDEQKFKELNAAYQVLSDEKKRAQYDQFGTAFDGNTHGSGSQGFGADFNGDLGDIFEQFFGGRAGAGFRGRARTGERRNIRGEDIYMDREITLEESFAGKDEIFSLKKFVVCPRCSGSRREQGSGMRTCATCSGKGEVQEMQQTFLGTFTHIRTCPECKGEGHIAEKSCRECRGDGRVQQIREIRAHIPAGIDTGEMMRITGEGEAASGGQAGDLYIRAHIRKHSFFVRRGSDLYGDLSVPFSLAALGGEETVRTIDGSVKLEIPAGIQSGTSLKLQSKGMPRLSRGGRGDYYIKITVQIPKKISAKAREYLKKLKEEGL